MFVPHMKVFIVIFFTAIVAALLMGTAGCANIIPPAGGPKDSLPPQLVSAVPADSTLNFRGDRITLTFDEYIDLQDVPNNLLFTPTLPATPEVSVKLRTITIKLRDTLDPNTTYIFNFGNAIKDINEGNILPHFTYTFSTGPALDTLTLGGKVVMAETGKIDTTLQVLLHKSSDDSAVINERPRYVTRLDAGGNFMFQNLPAGTFYIYALGNAGIVRRYTSKTQDFAFADSPIIVRPGAPPVMLYAYREAAPVRPAATTSVVPARERRGAATSNNRLRYTTNLINGNQQDLLTDLILSFDVPLKTVDTGRMVLTKDSSFTPVPHYFLLDSSRRILTIKTNWTDARYNLVLDKAFATDTTGRQLLKSDTLFFTTKKRAEYGSLNINLKGIDATRNPVLQLVQNGVVVDAAPVASGVFNKPVFLPGEYELRLLFDRNKNGVWDAGNFFRGKIQPEIVQPLSRKIIVKPAWNNDFDILL